MHRKDNTILWAIIACFLWSTAYAGIKIGLRHDSPIHFAALRFIISGLIILPFSVKPAVFFSMLRKNRQIFFGVTSLQAIVCLILFYRGMDFVPGALGAVVVGSQPLVTAVIASLMDKYESLNRGKILTIVAGISGVILISAGRQAFKLGTLIELFGVFLLLGANVAAATSNVMISLKSRGIHPFVLSSASFLTGGTVLLILSLLFEDIHFGPKPAEYWISLSWLGFMSAAAFSIWYKLLQRPAVKVSELNLWKFIIPVVGAILSWLLVPGEKPDWLTLTGMLIITVSLILFNKNGIKRINT